MGVVWCVGFPGILDPCDGGDTIAGLTAQQRADLTLSAQVCVYLLIHVVYCIVGNFGGGLIWQIGEFKKSPKFNLPLIVRARGINCTHY